MQKPYFFNQQQYDIIADSINADHSQYTISLLVANKPGVLGRVALVFSRRGYNIESLSVTHTLDRKFSRIVITTEGHEELLSDIIGQTRKIVDVIHIELEDNNITKNSEQEFNFYKIECSKQSKPVILRIIEDSPYHLVDFQGDSLVIQISDLEKSHTFLEMIRHYGSVEKVQLASREPLSKGDHK